MWINFYDTVNNLSGYKDLKGDIKIAPRFTQVSADSFYNINAVTEEIDGSLISYYLLKNGRKIGKDSVYMFDFTFDCESERKILFNNKKNDRVGFFDSAGNVIIPAIYNYANSFYHGLAVARKNAKRKCWDGGKDTVHCEHLGWEGGELVLINEKNEILADSLNEDLGYINWYSLKQNAVVDTAIYISIKGRNSITYSFIDYEKEFRKWFADTFLISLKQGDSNGINQLLFSEITLWDSEDGWVSLEKEKYVKKFPFVLSWQKFHVNKLKTLSIISEDLNQFIYEEKLYRRFFNACGIHNRELFPLFHLTLTYYKKRKTPLKTPPPPWKTGGKIKFSDFDKKYEISYQENFEFLRTESGYKVLSVSVN